MLKEYFYELNWGPKMEKNSSLLAKLEIHYEGLSSDYEMSIEALAISWQGLAHIISNSVAIAMYGNVTEKNINNIRITTKAELKPGSIWTELYVKIVELDLFSGGGAAILGCVMGYFFSTKSQKEKIKELEDKIRNLTETNTELKIALKFAEQKAFYEKNIENIKKSVEDLELKMKKFGRQFVTPIGTECDRISCICEGQEVFSVDKFSKDIFNKEKIIGQIGDYEIFIRKLDKKTGSCNVLVTDGASEVLVPAVINDGKFTQKRNPYLESFANRFESKTLTVQAQPEFNEDGKLIKLRIFDVYDQVKDDKHSNIQD